MKISWFLILALSAGAVLAQDSAPAAKPGNAAPRAAAPSESTGTVVWKGSGSKAMLIVRAGKDNLQWKPFGKDGKLNLPIGHHDIANICYEIDGCMVLVNCPGLTLTVAREPVEVAPVDAVTVKITAGKMNAAREISLTLESITAKGFKVTFSKIKDPNVKHGYRILDAAGKEVAKGTFEFG